MRPTSLPFLFVLSLLVIASCQEELPCDGRLPCGTQPEFTIKLSPTLKVAPSADFPKEVTTNVANNNLDIIDFKGRMFFAFRTAPSHFADKDTQLYVLSTTDEKRWTFESRFFLGTDLREPRFFAFKDRLWIYFSQLGVETNSFDPGQMYRSELLAQGKWSAPEKVFQVDFIPWRFKWHHGIPYMLGYEGGANIYNFTGDPISVYMLTTTNGTDWTPVNPKRPVVLKGGSSETDIEFDAEGNLFAVSRNEAGDETGFVSKICWAPKDDITHWECKYDLKKYDSPLLINNGKDIFLIGRRNVTETGNYDLQLANLDYAGKLAKYQIEYVSHPKRCAVWHYNQNRHEIEFILDLPSRGDTCFPSALPRGENTFLIYNYSNEIEGPDLTWRQGQFRNSFIYSTTLTVFRGTR